VFPGRETGSGLQVSRISHRSDIVQEKAPNARPEGAYEARRAPGPLVLTSPGTILSFYCIRMSRLPNKRIDMI
jgi:hypothetical protein